MTDPETITETKWDIASCNCAECEDWDEPDEPEPADFSAMVWLIGAGMVWVTAACLWLWY